MTRREFLAAAAVAGGAMVLNGADAKKVPPIPKPKSPQVGSQLYGWGQYYERAGKDLGKNLDEVLMALRDAGYDLAPHPETKKLCVVSIESHCMVWDAPATAEAAN